MKVNFFMQALLVSGFYIYRLAEVNLRRERYSETRNNQKFCRRCKRKLQKTKA